MPLIQQENQLICSCGNGIFITMGDDFGFTVVECEKCAVRTSILESSLIAEKLLSPRGEDYCKIFGRVDDTVLAGGIAIVDYLLFTEFDTAVIISAINRLERVVAAKHEAVANQWFERAARLRDEERIIHSVLQQQNKFLNQH